MDYGLFPANVTTGSVIERNGMGKQEALSRDYQGSSTALDSLQLTDAVDDEEEEPQPIVAHKRARKSGSGRDGKTVRTFLESLQKRKQAVGVRTRRQAQLEDQEKGDGEERG
jgi:hypothetical protein